MADDKITTAAPVLNEKPAVRDVEETSSIRKADSYSDVDIDAIIPGSEGVTQRDMDTYRHVADTMPLSAWFVVIVEFAERCVFSTSTHDVSSTETLPSVGHTTARPTCTTTTFVPHFLGTPETDESSMIVPKVLPVLWVRVNRLHLLSVRFFLFRACRCRSLTQSVIRDGKCKRHFSVIVSNLA